jgi:gas vesicle protein
MKSKRFITRWKRGSLKLGNKWKKKIIENKEEMKRNMDDNKNSMKKKMDENKEEIQKTMKELQNCMSSMMFQALDERLPKGDIKMQGTHENKGSIHVEQPTDNK